MGLPCQAKRELLLQQHERPSQECRLAYREDTVPASTSKTAYTIASAYSRTPTLDPWAQTLSAPYTPVGGSTCASSPGNGISQRLGSARSPAPRIAQPSCVVHVAPWSGRFG